MYITKTRATRISDTVFFKHQYITNPTVSPESHVVAAAQQLATALKGNIPAGNKTVEALKKVSKLFTKIVATKNKAAKAKEQCNRVRATPAARKTTHSPRVEALIPRVAAGPEEDCRIEQIVANPSVPWQLHTPPQHVPNHGHRSPTCSLPQPGGPTTSPRTRMSNPPP
jgi:hypothetical protein